ncbi:HAMP domain-containing sensor histidine kinase [Halarcobacter sp.]|uniref:HAMP domain-containing sensor histidine kinase n=1 Tax=Halarcobacter sp. TaxID=2321133 RepID=UPI002AA7E7FD|nr:HAMP domain-containing sensor histidine kinase [Halarcobacter sp.]
MEKRFFKELLNNTIEGILIIKDGFIEDINNSMLNILDYKDKDEVVGKLATGILIPNVQKKYLEYNNEIFEEVSLVSKNAKIVPAIIKIKDIDFKNEIYKLVFIQNLTELKKKEMLLLEQSRMAAMGEMISMIAHQWRQPLSSIAAATSNLKFRVNLEKYEKDVFNKKLTDIDKYLNYMSTTIDDFRNFFKTKKEKEAVSLDEVIENSLEMIEKAFENNNIKIINNKKNLPKVYIFKNELLQVILNIFNNSKDAFKEQKIKSNAHVTVDYKDEEYYQIIEISDNAGGIREEIIDKIFDPYFSTKDKKNGTGIGLYMCKIILEKHCDGQITANNIPNGACFKIKIAK